MESTINETVVAEDPVVNQGAEETPEEINWKKFRDERKRDQQIAAEEKRKRNEIAEQNRIMKETIAMLNQRPDLTQKEKNNIVASIPHDQFTTGQDVVNYVDSKIEAFLQNKLDALLDQRERVREERKRQEEQQTFPDKLRREYKDFDDVCSNENLLYMEYHHPELSKSLEDLPEGFEKWSRIYKAVKRYMPNQDTKKTQAKIESNLSKPKSGSSLGTASKDDKQSIRLDEAAKRANWERMQKALKGS
jgi:hypothetical protein